MRFFVSLFLLFVFVSCSPSLLKKNFSNPRQSIGIPSTTFKKYAELDLFIDSVFKVYDIPALSVVVTKDGEIIYENNKGYRELPTNNNNSGEPLKSGDLFRIASISKTFTATVVMKLIEEGKLALEDDAQIYLPYELRNPQFPDIPITIDMFLTHTSSITDSMGYKKVGLIDPKINTEYKKSYSGYKPGTHYQYSNLGYNILGSVIEGATGKRFDEVADEYIIKPLSLNASFNPNKLDANKFVNLYYYNTKKNIFTESKDAYNPHTKEMDDYILGVTTSILSPCGGMKISSRDLAKYMNMHINNGDLDGKQIISSESEHLLRTDYQYLKNYYGHSLMPFYKIWPGKILYGHDGGAYGMNSLMVFESETKLGFVIMTSGNNLTDKKATEEIHKPIIKFFLQLFEKE